MLPSFLICGGQRCGTTSLYRALATHPGVLKAVLHKGVHYFDVGYHRGMRWYRAHFPLQRSGMQTFESSPYYMYHPHAVPRIAADLPGVKLLVLDSGRFFADPEPVYDAVLDFLGLARGPYPRFERHNARPRAADMPAVVRAELAAHFAPFDARLADWLGHRPSWCR